MVTGISMAGLYSKEKEAGSGFGRRPCKDSVRTIEDISDAALVIMAEFTTNIDTLNYPISCI